MMACWLLAQSKKTHQLHVSLRLGWKKRVVTTGGAAAAPAGFGCGIELSGAAAPAFGVADEFRTSNRATAHSGEKEIVACQDN